MEEGCYPPLSYRFPSLTVPILLQSGGLWEHRDSEQEQDHATVLEIQMMSSLSIYFTARPEILKEKGLRTAARVNTNTCCQVSRQSSPQTSQSKNQ